MSDDPTSGRPEFTPGAAESAHPPGDPATAAPAGSSPPQRRRAARRAARRTPVHGWRRVRRVTLRVLKWGVVTGLVLVLALVTTVYVVYERTTIPSANKAFQANTSFVYYADGRHEIGSFSLQNRQTIPLSEVPRHVQDAVVAAENRTFWTDRGLDPKSILRAAWSDLTSGSTQGGSTITQQYVKVLYLTEQRTWKRKIKEAFLALKLDNTLSKKQILAGYLNTIYFGRGSYGVQAAAEAYFGRDARQLNVAQGAVLAAVLNAPGALDPAVRASNATALLARYQYVLRGMVTLGDITAQQADRLSQRLPKLNPYTVTNDKVGQRGFMLELVEQQLRAEGFTEEQIYGGGLRIVTTFNWRDQHSAIAAVKQVAPHRLKKLHVAVASIDPRTGALRAMFGGHQYPGINWALAGGQPGSTFKAFALAAALKDGFTLNDTFNGSPFDLPDGEHVENEGENGGQSLGPITLLNATENSVNTAYVDMTMKMKGNGPDKIRAALAAAGIPTKGIAPVPNIALGTQVVPVIKMAEGYATFANQGVHNNWYVIQTVSDASGTRYEHTPHPKRVFSRPITSNVTYALEQVVNAGTGLNARALGRPAAGKTGTATALDRNGVGQHVSSSWFIGYTPQLTTAVMYVRGRGNENLNGYLQPSFFGGELPTLTWTAYMKAALAGKPVLTFPPPANLHGTQRPTPVTVAPAPSTTPPTSTTPPPSTSTSPPTSTAPTTPTTPTTGTTTTTPTTTTPSSGGPSGAGPTQRVLPAAGDPRRSQSR